MSKAVFVGGYNGSSSYSADVYMTEDNITFTKMADFPLAINGASVCLFNNEWYVIGGEITGGTKQSTVYKSTDLSSWTLVTNTPGWSARSSASIFIYQNKMWLIGGKVASTGTVDIYNTNDGNTWTKISSLPSLSVNTFVAPVVANETLGIFIFGGKTGVTLKNTIYKSTDGIAWTSSTPTWDARENHAVVFFNNLFLLIGGSDAVGSAFSSSKYFYTSTDGITWTAKSDSNLYTLFGAYLVQNLYGKLDNKLILFGSYLSGVSNKILSTIDGTTWVVDTTTSPTSIYKRNGANLAVKVEAVTPPTLSFPANGSSTSSGNASITLGSALQAGMIFSANGSSTSSGAGMIKLGIKLLANGNSTSLGQATIYAGIIDNTSYVLRGRVINKTTGLPVVGATVTAVNQLTNQVYTATTDVNGNYELLCRIKGTYDLFSRFKDTYNNHFTSLLKSYVAVGG